MSCLRGGARARKADRAVAVKLLFDENLSPRLVAILAAEFPDSAHVHSVALGQASDVAIWDYAKAHEYVIASKDSDLAELSIVRGAPPKLVWLRPTVWSERRSTALYLA